MLFTFPSRYWFTIGRQGVFSLTRWSSQIPSGFHVSRGTRVPDRATAGFEYGALTLFGRPSQTVLLPSLIPRLWPHNPAPACRCGLGCSRFAHHYSGNRDFFPLLRVLRCFSSPRSPPHAYVFSMGYRPITAGGFPHSDIPGSSPVRGSPRLIAAYHVLHRLLTPRHPP